MIFSRSTLERNITFNGIFEIDCGEGSKPTSWEVLVPYKFFIKLTSLVASKSVLYLNWINFLNQYV